MGVLSTLVLYTFIYKVRVGSYGKTHGAYNYRDVGQFLVSMWCGAAWSIIQDKIKTLLEKIYNMAQKQIKQQNL